MQIYTVTAYFTREQLLLFAFAPKRSSGRVMSLPFLFDVPHDQSRVLMLSSEI